ncbi:MAG TPA: hypothetical protein VFU42_10400 [Candidatus Deferrimicrobiaceae bacterium]|nr:hypothetical protein [Candidatus Deferrimicrobiaceae bacterium]
MTADEALSRIAGKRIFFGHQSVGRDILDGIRRIAAEQPGRGIEIVEAAGPAVFDRPVFAHAKIGKNRDPASKCAAFFRILENGLGDQADIAFFKFCYIDFSAGTDASQLYRRYRDTLSGLSARFPRTCFLPVTAPLTCPDRRTALGRLAGLVTGAESWVHANRERDRFNELLRSDSVGKEPVYDLALLESTAPDGTRVVSSRDGVSSPSLFPGYTDDGGHLNSLGKRVAAENLLLLLAGLS